MVLATTEVLQDVKQPKGDCAMNTDILEGNWKQVKGQVQQKWGKLTDDELDQIAGRREELVGRIQERYGQEKDAVRKEVNAFLDQL